MRYKREEAFRYSFKEPILALFYIKEIDGKKVKSSEGPASIMNISPEGAKIHSSFNMPMKTSSSTHLSITFELNGNYLTVDGTIVWKKENAKGFDYGIDLDIDDETKNTLVEHLKIQAKQK
ncbi:PilZ domain-containing protein [Aquibacillus koreensis]|uniref:PilZ domain-containing protein n=1 Tax=Aquibacillus koreensis TaxID=279446 RepID=A0A9X3WPJ9_9BACI|nr:PilZ domain-containing protein [Aquibacillus koreensis]MCT2535251.1 PilZ domain-containing protein [Aquibacillus koreensis]MDC3422790.1 PilZ domain-containing protein [Aquibacillus koreensis]